MKYRIEPVDDWLWGNLYSVKRRLRTLKNGKIHRKDNSVATQDMCVFCGSGAGYSANEDPKHQHLSTCHDCSKALAYGYVTEVLKLKDNS